MQWERYFHTTLLATERHLFAQAHYARFLDDAAKRGIFGIDDGTFKEAASSAHKHLMAYLRMNVPWIIGTDEEMAAKQLEHMKAQYSDRFGSWDDEKNNRVIDAVVAALLKRDRRRRRPQKG